MNLYEENIKQLTEISNFLELTQPAPINKKYQCTISDAISAFKTLEDIGAPICDESLNVGNILAIMPFKNVSRETLINIANHKCTPSCTDCEYNNMFGCISSLVIHYLTAKGFKYELADEKEGKNIGK